MSQEQFDPVKAGQEEAAKNSKGVAKAVKAEEDSFNENVEDAQKLAKKNAKLDDSRRGEAEMKPQDVGTSERDIPEGAPVTDEPEESEYKPGGKADSKNPETKKDLPDDKKRQDTSKDSATPSPSEESKEEVAKPLEKADNKSTNANEKDGK